MAVYKLELRLGALRPGHGAGGKENELDGKNLGTITLREADLFDEGEASLLPAAWGRILSRLSDKVDFEVAGFRYVGPDIALPLQDDEHQTTILPQPGDEWVYVNSAKVGS